MKKGIPKRKDLRKRIAELEKENARLWRPEPTPVAIYNAFPKRIGGEAWVWQHARVPLALSRQQAINELTKSLANSVVSEHLVEITEVDYGNGYRVIRMLASIVPPQEDYSEEIIEAINFNEKKPDAPCTWDREDFQDPWAGCYG